MSEKLPTIATPERARSLRRIGHSYAEIGKALGVTTSEAFTLANVDAAVLGTSPEKATELAMDLERCDALIRAWWPLAMGKVEKVVDKRSGFEEVVRTPPDVEAAKVMIAVLNRRARYLGLDAPTKSEVTGKGGAPIQVLGVDISSLSDAQLDALCSTNDVRSIGQDSHVPVLPLAEPLAEGGGGDGAAEEDEGENP